MAQRQARRSQSSNGKAPISSHRLFPAIVALWFAALFGLGTMVLPNILLERAVTTTGIASLVSAAAPPLGVTARIAISVSAGVIGAILGFVIASRVASAQAAARPANLDRRFRNTRQAAASAARRPISVKEELGGDPVAKAESPVPTAQQAGGRRRSLAIEEDNRPSDFLHAAPLPGGDPGWHDSHPMMPSMDVVARKEAAKRDGVLERFARQAEATEDDVEPLVLNELVEVQPGDHGLAALKNNAPTEVEPEPMQQFEAPAMAPPAQQFGLPAEAQAAPVAPVAASVEAPAPQQFAPEAPVSLPFSKPVAQPEPATALAAPMGPVAPTEIPQSFAQPVAAAPEPVLEPAVAQEFVPASAPVESGPIQDFSAPLAHQAASADPFAPFMAPVFDEDEEEIEEVSAIEADPFASPAAAEAVVGEAAEGQIDPQADEDEPLVFFAPSQPLPKPAEETQPLHELGIIELAERLSRSMQGHAKPASAPPAEALAAIASAVAEPAEIEFEPEIVEEAEAFAEVEIEATEPAQPREFAMPLAEANQPEVEAPRQFDQPVATGIVPPPPVVPDALRPYDPEFDEVAETDEDHHSLSFPTGAPAPAVEPASIAAPEAAKPVLPAAFAPIDEEEDEPQESYGSLLAMRNPFRSQAEFVRIEEPEPEVGAIEPAVVFPGQAPIPAASETPSPFASPLEARIGAPAPSAQATAQPASEFRPFDAPNEKVTKLAPAPQRAKIDPAEAERALRTALATLQRMSGAA